MIKQFDSLTSEERDMIFHAPVLVSVLAACSYEGINESQKADAIKLAHIRTFTSTPLLIPFYKEVERRFKEKFEETARAYFPFDEENVNDLKRELTRVAAVLAKLEPDYARKLYKSLQSYASHVEKAAHSVFQDFLFPMPIPGLSV